MADPGASEPKYEVQSIQDHRLAAPGSAIYLGSDIEVVTDYLVRWVGCAPSDDSWEPAANLAEAFDVVYAYWVNTGRSPRDFFDFSVTRTLDIGVPSPEPPHIFDSDSYDSDESIDGPRCDFCDRPEDQVLDEDEPFNAEEGIGQWNGDTGCCYKCETLMVGQQDTFDVKKEMVLRLGQGVEDGVISFSEFQTCVGQMIDTIKPSLYRERLLEYLKHYTGTDNVSVLTDEMKLNLLHFTQTVILSGVRKIIAGEERRWAHDWLPAVRFFEPLVSSIVLRQ